MRLENVLGNRAWLACGSPEGGSTGTPHEYQQAKPCVATVDKETKTQSWEWFGEYMEENCPEGIVANVPCLGRAKATLYPHLLQAGWVPAVLNRENIRAVEGKFLFKKWDQRGCSTIGGLHCSVYAWGY